MKVRILNSLNAALSSAGAVTGVGALAWMAFHSLGDHFLFFAAITLLSFSSGSLLLLFTGIFMLKNAAASEKFKPPQFKEECGLPFEWNLAGTIPSMKLLAHQRQEWCIPRLKQLANGRLLAKRRGVFSEFSLLIEATDLLGLVKVRLMMSGPAEIVVFPAGVTVPGSILEDQQSGGDTEDAQSGTPEGDLLETHQHQRGQSFRHFMWKAYHRSQGRIMLVRKPEKTATSSKLFFFLPSEDDEPGASLVKLLVEDKLAGENWWLFVPGSESLLGPPDREKAMQCLAQSGNWQGDLSGEIKKFEGMASGIFAGANGVIILTNLPQVDRGAWADKLRLAVHELAPSNPSIIVAISKGQHFDPQSLEGEFGTARPVEIDMPINLGLQAES